MFGGRKNSGRSRARWMSLAIILAAILAISACSSSGSGDSGASEDDESTTDTAEAGDVTYEADVKGIIADNCLTCHGEDSSAPMHDYESLLAYVNGEDAGLLMRALDNGDNTDDGEPGFMYEHLGETDEERDENLAVLKEWVGHWTLEKSDEWTDEDREKIKAIEN